MSKSKRLTVVDFFCGAGGFSEGFRQQGFDVLMGVDYWATAVDSHNLNHNLNDTPKDILDFWGCSSDDVSDIEYIPDSTVIIGSPSCVSFSMSNKAGKADKTNGVKLIEAYLRVVAVKKHKNKSKLIAWYLENVPQSENHIKNSYTFADLNLANWAKLRKINPNSIALNVNGEVLNAGDYGAPQNRKRYVCGEWVENGKFLSPTISHKKHVSSEEIRKKLPLTTLTKAVGFCSDPNYKQLKINGMELTDHFYDTGLYSIEWEKAEHLKTNHPYMGKMSFPENEKKSCRTIMATRSASTRESLIYKSEYSRKGNGEYRLPTIREIACLMGYPICYQFVGSEAAKWKQIGNSVSPHLSSALAKVVREKLGLSAIESPNFDSLIANYNKIENLNTYKEKKFNLPKRRSISARFRRHPLKAGNMTVDLLNFHPENADSVGKKWYVAAFFGTGNTHGIKIFKTSEIIKIENKLVTECDEFYKFKKIVEGMSKKRTGLQAAYESDLDINNSDNPIIKVKSLGEVVLANKNHEKIIEWGAMFPKQKIPLSQAMVAYGLLKIIE